MAKTACVRALIAIYKNTYVRLLDIEIYIGPIPDLVMNLPILMVRW